MKKVSGILLLLALSMHKGYGQPQGPLTIYEKGKILESLIGYPNAFDTSLLQGQKLIGYVLVIPKNLSTDTLSMVRSYLYHLTEDFVVADQRRKIKGLRIYLQYEGDSLVDGYSEKMFSKKPRFKKKKERFEVEAKLRAWKYLSGIRFRILDMPDTLAIQVGLARNWEKGLQKVVDYFIETSRFMAGYVIRNQEKRYKVLAVYLTQMDGTSVLPMFFEVEKIQRALLNRTRIYYSSLPPKE